MKHYNLISQKMKKNNTSSAIDIAELYISYM